MENKSVIDNPWRYLPCGLFASLLIWGALIGQLTWQSKQLRTMTAELVEMPRLEKHLIVPSQPKPKPVSKTTLPQISAPAQKPVVQASSRTTSLPSIPAVSLPATDRLSGNQVVPSNVAAGLKSNAKSAQASGGSVTPPQFGAAYLNNPKPAYPAFARRMRIQGTVMLKVLVSREGVALKIQVAQTSGSDILDSAAAETVKKWRFVPARHGDSPVDEWVQVPIAFHLTG